jgi:hypothetical protein
LPIGIAKTLHPGLHAGSDQRNGRLREEFYDPDITVTTIAGLFADDAPDPLSVNAALIHKKSLDFMQPDARERPHERRYEHDADKNRRTVGKQTAKRNKIRQGQDEQLAGGDFHFGDNDLDDPALVDFRGPPRYTG